MNIPYGKQLLDNKDIEEVIRVLNADFLTQGPEVENFENAFSSRIGAKHSVAVSNGTAALHLAAMALGVKPGQRVITTPITFAASANCVLYCGAEVEFCDIDPDTYLIDLNKLEAMIKAKPKNYYAGVIPVDFGGLMPNLIELNRIAKENDLWIIEDACHAPGAYFTDDKGNKHFAGEAEFVDCSVFSFHPVKHIACGEGGMVTTNRDDLNENLQLLRTHGITKNPKDLSKSDGPWYYEMQELGFNYRLTDFQSALGRMQLKKLDWSLERRNFLADEYKHAFKDLPISFQALPEGFYNAHHLFVLRTDRRKELFEYLRSKQIYAQIHYIPVHLMPYYASLGWKEGDLPEAEAYYKECISIPMYPSINTEEKGYVINTIKSFFNA